LNENIPIAIMATAVIETVIFFINIG